MTILSDPKPTLAARVLAHDRAALARLLSHLENGTPAGDAAMDELYVRTGNAHIIGITGPPGAGKSTLVNELVREYRQRGQRVAVIAVDPSSPLTGGATLGDRIRMLEWHADPDVFIRSMASRAHGGGLAESTLAVAQAFDAAGFDPILIETVGTGQDEVRIASLAQTTVLVQVPGTGDSVQSIKAGSLEIGDLLVVTKGDRPESADLARDLRAIASIARSAGAPERPWEPPVIRCSAITGDGVDEVVDALSRHRGYLETSGELATRTRAAVSAEIAGRVQSAIVAHLASLTSGSPLADLVDQVTEHCVTPQRAAQDLVRKLLGSHPPSEEGKIAGGIIPDRIQPSE